MCGPGSTFLSSTLTARKKREFLAARCGWRKSGPVHYHPTPHFLDSKTLLRERFRVFRVESEV